MGQESSDSSIFLDVCYYFDLHILYYWCSDRVVSSALHSRCDPCRDSILALRRRNRGTLPCSRLRLHREGCPDGSAKAIGVESRFWADGHTNLVVSGNSGVAG